MITLGMALRRATYGECRWLRRGVSSGIFPSTVRQTRVEYGAWGGRGKLSRWRVDGLPRSLPSLLPHCFVIDNQFMRVEFVPASGTSTTNRSVCKPRAKVIAPLRMKANELLVGV